MINLNNHRKNIYKNYGFKECPYYGEDGVILKIFENIDINKKPNVVEFGEHRVLGTTTRAFRIKYFADSLYFAGDIGLKTHYLNILKILKVSLTKNILYFKFLFNLPFKYYVHTNNILKLLFKKKLHKIDLFCIDIDSFDYFIVKKILESEISCSLFIVEYNPNLPLNKSLAIPSEFSNIKIKNKRIYGASFLALYNLFKKYEYKLIHISGFCNLFFIKKNFSSKFMEPDYIKEIPQNDDDIIKFIIKYCQPNFIPSWLYEKKLNSEDLNEFKNVD